MVFKRPHLPTLSSLRNTSSLRDVPRKSTPRLSESVDCLPGWPRHPSSRGNFRVQVVFCGPRTTKQECAASPRGVHSLGPHIPLCTDIWGAAVWGPICRPGGNSGLKPKRKVPHGCSFEKSCLSNHQFPSLKADAEEIGESLELE